MALKDLVASKASLAEDVIEQIISDYVRFDADQKEIVLTPDAHGLSNKAKILIYLVALQGWPYVLDEVVPVDAKPGEIEERTNIAGGSLRPLLRDLKDRKIISEKGGRYSVRAVALRTIQDELDGKTAGSTSGKRSARRKQKSEEVSEAATDSASNDDPPSDSKKKSRRSAGGGVAERFQSWIDSGYFDKPKSLGDVQERFHKEAIIVPQTSLPSYLLKGVRSGQLERDKAEKNGKTVWLYSRKK
jgi:hypothetical protein